MHHGYTAVCDPPCENGATCTQDLQCHCAPGWTGDVCDEGMCAIYACALLSQVS